MAALVFPSAKCWAGKKYRFRTQPRAFFKEVNPLPVAPGDFLYRGRAVDSVRPPINQRFPKGRAAYGKTDEPRDAGRCRQPRADLLVVFPTPQDDATYSLATVPTRSRDEVRAILMPIHSFDFPDVRLNTRNL